MLLDAWILWDYEGTGGVFRWDQVNFCFLGSVEGFFDRIYYKLFINQIIGLLVSLFELITSRTIRVAVCSSFF